jgi:hypothetical protein
MYSYDSVRPMKKPKPSSEVKKSGDKTAAAPFDAKRAHRNYLARKNDRGEEGTDVQALSPIDRSMEPPPSAKNSHGKATVPKPNHFGIIPDLEPKPVKDEIPGWMIKAQHAERERRLEQEICESQKADAEREMLKERTARWSHMKHATLAERLGMTTNEPKKAEIADVPVTKETAPKLAKKKPAIQPIKQETAGESVEEKMLNESAEKEAMPPLPLPPSQLSTSVIPPEPPALLPASLKYKSPRSSPKKYLNEVAKDRPIMSDAIDVGRLIDAQGKLTAQAFKTLFYNQLPNLDPEILQKQEEQYQAGLMINGLRKLSGLSPSSFSQKTKGLITVQQLDKYEHGEEAIDLVPRETMIRVFENNLPHFEPTYYFKPGDFRNICEKSNTAIKKLRPGKNSHQSRGYSL